MLERGWTPPEREFLVPGTMAQVGFQSPLPSWNRLLGALPVAEYARLLPDLKLVSLPPGGRIYDSGEQQRYLYFLTGGIVCRQSVLDDGASAGAAVTGSEGVIGLASFLGGGSTTSEVVVLIHGYAYALRADLRKGQFEHNGPLLRLLLRYTQALFTQVAQIVACNKHHSIEQRLCRLLLSCLDRLPSSSVTMTHERVADVLGVRREGVTEAVGTLRMAGVLHSCRGQIAVLDRSRLETYACDCHRVGKREYDRLLADYQHTDLASTPRPVTRIHTFPQRNAARV